MPRKNPILEPCAVEGCERLIKYSKRGWCDAHYKRWLRHGHPTTYLRHRRNPEGFETRRDHNGYVLIYKNQKELREHRVVMEGFIGRPLVKGEFVHHKNGNRADNRLENLELWTRFHPSGQRAADLLAWAKEIVAKYEGTPLET